MDIKTPRSRRVVRKKVEPEPEMVSEVASEIAVEPEMAVEMPVMPSAMPKVKKSSKKLKYLFVILIIAAIFAGGSYAAKRMGYIGTQEKNANVLKQGEISKGDQAVLDQLGKIILLPADVTPTMAVITDVTKLQEQQPEFFVNAKNGDRLIVYPTLAIIFDAKANKIMKVGPVQTGQQKTQPVYFAVYNGSGEVGKGKIMEEKIKTTFTNAEVKIVENAATNDYAKTLVIDLTEKKADISKIAEAIGGEVTTLPEGEVKPEGVSFLVIVGKE